MKHTTSFSYCTFPLFWGDRLRLTLLTSRGLCFFAKPWTLEVFCSSYPQILENFIFIGEWLWECFTFLLFQVGKAFFLKPHFPFRASRSYWSRRCSRFSRLRFRFVWLFERILEWKCFHRCSKPLSRQLLSWQFCSFRQESLSKVLSVMSFYMECELCSYCSFPFGSRRRWPAKGMSKRD